MADTNILGLIGNSDWVTDERPKNWREGILFLYPNGDAPLTALMSKLSSRPTDDPEFNWWTKTLATQGGTFTADNVYTDAALSTKYTSGGVIGDTVYSKMTNVQGGAAAHIQEFRVGHIVQFRDASDPTMLTIGKVTAIQVNSTSSYIAVELLEADDNGSSTYLANADSVWVIGNVNSEGAEMPAAISRRPSKMYNYTQIFRTPLSITRTARKTRLRTGDQYKEMKREALELHSIEMEKAFLWGIGTENTGDNGKPERTTCGLIRSIKGMNPGSTAGSETALGNVHDFDGAWSHENFLTQLEVLFRYGSDERLCFCGSVALLELNKLAMQYGQISIDGSASAFGMRLVRWITPFGVIYLKRHPLFSYNSLDRASMVLFEPKNLTERPLDNTMFFNDKNETSRSDRRRVDSTDEEYLTETGMEFYHLESTGYFTTIGG